MSLGVKFQILDRDMNLRHKTLGRPTNKKKKRIKLEKAAEMRG